VTAPGATASRGSLRGTSSRSASASEPAVPAGTSFAATQTVARSRTAAGCEPPPARDQCIDAAIIPTAASAAAATRFRTL